MILISTTLRLRAASLGGAAALAFALFVSLFSPMPARADGAASTRNIILGAAAAIAADIIYNNIHHKAVARNTVVGYTRDGGTIYADGRVVYPSGDVLYTGNQNGQSCAYAGYGPACQGTPVVYYPRGYAGHDHGRHNGWYKHGDKDDRGDGDDRRDNDHRDNGHGDHGDH